MSLLKWIRQNVEPFNFCISGCSHINGAQLIQSSCLVSTELRVSQSVSAALCVFWYFTQQFHNFLHRLVITWCWYRICDNTDSQKAAAALCSLCPIHRYLYYRSKQVTGIKKGCIQVTVYLSTQTPSITNHSFLQKEYLPTLKINKKNIQWKSSKNCWPSFHYLKINPLLNPSFHIPRL